MADAGRDQFLERSRQIVDAAYELLDEEGLEGLTIRAVLMRTGLARRAFYERFAGKDDLMLAVFEQTIRRAASHYSAQIEPLSDPMERLGLIVTCIALGRSVPEGPDDGHGSRRAAALSREHLRLAESRPGDLQAALDPLLQLIARQLSDGMEAGSVRTGAPERLATLVYNLVSTTVHTELLAEEASRRDHERRVRLAADIWEFCRRAIAA
ncbi:TetR/AcrR family transcriptional regulator [Sphingomonas oligophenolica]|uniref:Helix-turn-helix domain-containing protein n=1 Tax=Sphingomonas oligophenolica TaxID=301154 RepID=A0ABU9Y4U2_9SPHN